ncbi:hypothetical protein BKA70DRAFT_94869 [Coprinopsis sp. MPI-PUGE-AT-0042]|nr:hypothetical protein BKA70DRAFT_94869 [Coprinopsis sp. MPI-PUGE-AT-0042]
MSHSRPNHPPRRGGNTQRIPSTLSSLVSLLCNVALPLFTTQSLKISRIRNRSGFLLAHVSAWHWAARCLPSVCLMFATLIYAAGSRDGLLLSRNAMGAISIAGRLGQARPASADDGGCIMLEDDPTRQTED